MSDIVFDQIHAHLAVAFDFNWTTATVMGLVVDSGGGALWTPGPTDSYVQTVLSAGATEPAPSADRQTLTTLGANVDGTDHVTYWTSDPIVYPGIPNLATFDTLVLYNFVTDDTDSWLIAAFDLGADTGDGADVTINSASKGWLFW